MSILNNWLDKGVVGVDLGDRAAHAALVVRGVGGRARLVGGVRSPRTSPDAWTPQDARALRDTLVRAGLNAKSVVLIAPARHLVSSLVELPPSTSGAPIEKLAQHELARIHRCEPESFSMAMWEVPTPDRKQSSTHMLVSGLMTEAGEAVLKAFDEAGMRVVAVEPRASALARACATEPVGAPCLWGVLDVGWSSSHAVLLHVGSGAGVVPVYERCLEGLGVGRVVEHAARVLHLSEENAFAALRTGADTLHISPAGREVLRTARAHQSEFFDRLMPEVQRSFSYAVQLYPSLPMTQVLTTGEGDGLRGLRERLCSTLGMEATALLPRRCALVAPGSVFGTESSLCAAIGAAMSPTARSHAERSAA